MGAVRAQGPDRPQIDSRLLIDGVHDAVLIFEPETEIVIDVNDRACELYGFTRDQFIGMSIKDISVSIEQGQVNVRRTLEADRYHSFPTLQLGADGTAMLLDVHAFTIEYDGRPAILSINRDITERTMMIRRVAAGVAEWQRTVDAIEAAIMLLDGSLHVLRVNETGFRLAGAGTANELVGLHIREVGHGEPWARVVRLAEEALASRKALSVRAMDEERLRTWDLAVTITGSADDEPRIVVVVKDVTREANLDRALRRSERMAEVGQLVAGVAHEVRNPLFSILASFGALEARLKPEDAAVQRHLVSLRRQIDRLSALMQDLLDYGRPAELSFERNLLDGAIHDAIASSSVSAKGIRIENDCPPGLGPLFLDRGRMATALRNLIDNSAAYTRDGTAVTIQGGIVERDGEPWVWVAVADRGPGFAVDDLPRIFEPFFSRRPGGTGLGLSIVRQIVEGHGGRLHARNRIGGGAETRIEIPCECNRT
jgi:PAS domain S-box-containing protein